MIQVSGVTHHFGSDRRLSFPDFSIASGNACLLLGKSGSGKTTLLHLIGGLLKAQSGTIKIFDTDLSTLTETQTDAFRGKHIGFVFQKNHLITALSVEKNLWMVPFLSGTQPNHARIQEILQQLGLWQKRKADIRQLSQGEAQRVAIGRAVLNKPSLIIADEPTSSLDDYHCEQVIRLLMKVAKDHHSTLLVATHDQRLKSVISRHVHINDD